MVHNALTSAGKHSPCGALSLLPGAHARRVGGSPSSGAALEGNSGAEGRESRSSRAVGMHSCDAADVVPSAMPVAGPQRRAL